MTIYKVLFRNPSTYRLDTAYVEGMSALDASISLFKRFGKCSIIEIRM